jgi:hypothetical protein
MTSQNKYVIISGYWADENRHDIADFHETWYKNTAAGDCDIYIINAGAKNLPRTRHGKWVDLTQNIGHVSHMISGIRNQKYCGWTISTLIGALIAYNCDSDMIYKEQDCLCFGSWVDAIYQKAQQENSKMIFGSSDLMIIEQSLVWVKYDYLLDYIKWMLDMPESDGIVLPEAKYKRIMEAGNAHFLPFGVGRNRPLPLHEKTWYAQKFTAEELEQVKNLL